jgi:ABC-type uncharacterized transport system YnjBCD ATPase subunit
VAFELAGGYQYQNEIKRVLHGLGFEPPEWDMPLHHLSGGQKTRLLLGRLLLEKPDLLILDEPTNHLDIHAIRMAGRDASPLGRGPHRSQPRSVLSGSRRHARVGFVGG